MPEKSVPNLKQMWEALSSDEKRVACECLFLSEEPFIRNKTKPIIEELARANRFREKFIQGKLALEKAKLLYQRAHTPDFSIYRDDLIAAWLVERCRPTLCGFLDAAAVAHQDGFRNGAENGEAPSLADCREALRFVAESEAPREGALYVAYLLNFEREEWPHLATAVEEEALDLDGMLRPRRPEKDEAVPQRQSATEEEAPQPEDSETFTTLDHWLIRSAVDTAFGQEGALTRDQLEDLVEETTELNASRARSLFHRGFLHSLFDREHQFHFPGENEERRVWYFTGAILGLLRKSENKRCLDLLETERKLTKTVYSNNRVPCAMMLLRQLWDDLLESENFALLQDWIRAQAPAWHPREAETHLSRLHEHAATLLRRGQSAEALALLAFVRDRLLDVRQLNDGFVEWLRPFNDRKIAQAYQSQGSLSAAEEILEGVIHNEHFDSKGNATTDLALIKGGFRTLASILPDSDREAAMSTLDGLEKSLPLLRSAVKKHGHDAVNAHFCLGIHHTLKAGENRTEAADHLKAAAAGMTAKEELYHEGRLIEWTRFLLGLALLETAEVSEYRNASERLEQAMGHETAYPLWLWERALQAAGLFDDDRLSKSICRHILGSRDQGASMRIVASSEILRKHPEIIPDYLAWLVEQRTQPAQKWKRLAALLEIALGSNRIRESEAILDALEGMALENSSCRKKFIRLLSEEDRYNPAWTERDAENRLVHLHELEGNAPEVATLLGKHFHEDQNREWSDRSFLAEIVDRIESLKVDGFDVEALRDRIDAAESEDSEHVAPTEIKAIILYVGGNEKQQAYEPVIRDRLAKKYPNLIVEFFFPGWSSNWNKPLEQILRRLDDADAVVLNSLVRTQFGRNLRKKCDGQTPWFPCNGRGEKSLRQSILRAAEWASNSRNGN